MQLRLLLANSQWALVAAPNPDFSGADLRGATSTSASLATSKLTNADLTGVDATGAKLDRVNFYQTTMPDGSQLPWKP